MPLTFAATAVTGTLRPLNFEQVLGPFAVASDLPALSGLAQMALIQPIGGAIRFTGDGSAPTGTRGIQVADGETIQYNGDLSQFQYIADGGGGATQLNVQYFQYGA